jgi:hypothetical protein
MDANFILHCRVVYAEQKHTYFKRRHHCVAVHGAGGHVEFIDDCIPGMLNVGRLARKVVAACPGLVQTHSSTGLERNRKARRNKSVGFVRCWATSTQIAVPDMLCMCRQAAFY